MPDNQKSPNPTPPVAETAPSPSPTPTPVPIPTAEPAKVAMAVPPNEYISPVAGPTPISGIQTEMLNPPVSDSATLTSAPPVPVFPQLAQPFSQVPVFRGSLGEKVISFIESRKVTGYVKLNDFLKSNFDQPLPGRKTGHASIVNIASIRGVLTTLAETGKVVFSNTNYKRLGENYYETGDPATRHQNLDSLVLEAKLP